MPKPKPSGTTKVPTYDSDNTEGDREHKALNGTAKDYIRFVREAATFAHIPETGAHHFN
jgi:hypothetical protein